MATRLMIGDVREQLALLDADSIDCVVTSPPYWGLRDYGVEGQIGLEPTLAEHLAVMVQVFSLVKRVLKPTGTLWINYGDCYATSPNGRSAAATKAAGNDDRTFRDKPFSTVQGVLKPKDLCMVPNRLAIALQEAGWWVRSEIVWGKTNPMPDSVKDRPGTAHEKIFLLTKSARYWYDAEAVRLAPAPATTVRLSQNVEAQAGSARANGGTRADRPMKAVRGRTTYGKHTLNDNVPADDRREKIRASDVASPRHAGHINHTGIEKTPRGEGRNLRNYEPAPMDVWPIATKPFSEAHFATFPPELAERCILAGCPVGGTVLDPFGGAGTTALVAERKGRNAVLIELNPEYAEITRRRLLADGGLFASVNDNVAPALAGAA